MVYFLGEGFKGMKYTILIVEDNVLLRRSVAEVLRFEDYHVLEAGRVDAALSLYRQYSPQYVLLDIRLPDGDGLNLIENMRALHDSYIIMFTSLNDIGSKRTAYERGTDDYVCKPFDVRELVLKLKAAASRIRSLRDVFEIGDVCLDTGKNLLSCGEKRVSIQPSQASLLRLLWERHETGSFLRLKDAHHLGEEVHTDTQVHLRVTRLRKALSSIGAEEMFIESIYGEGYTLVVQDRESGWK